MNFVKNQHSPPFYFRFLRKLQDIENALKKLQEGKSDAERRADQLTNRLESLSKTIQVNQMLRDGLTS